MPLKRMRTEARPAGARLSWQHLSGASGIFAVLPARKERIRPARKGACSGGGAQRLDFQALDDRSCNALDWGSLLQKSTRHEAGEGSYSVSASVEITHARSSAAPDRTRSLSSRLVVHAAFERIWLHGVVELICVRAFSLHDSMRICAVVMARHDECAFGHPQAQTEATLPYVKQVLCCSPSQPLALHTKLRPGLMPEPLRPTRSQAPCKKSRAGGGAPVSLV